MLFLKPLSRSRGRRCTASPWPQGHPRGGGQQPLGSTAAAGEGPPAKDAWDPRVCGFEGRLTAYYRGHWEPVLSSILIMVWVFKPTRSNTFWVLLVQNLCVFYQNVSSNAYNTNLYTPTKLDDSFWVAQFFSHPATLSKTSSLPRKQSMFVNNTSSSVHIMAGIGQNRKSSFKNPSIRSKLCSHKTKSAILV